MKVIQLTCWPCFSLLCCQYSTRAHLFVVNFFSQQALDKVTHLPIDDAITAFTLKVKTGSVNSE